MKIFLYFPKSVTEEPIISRLIEEKGVRVNILRARINPHEDGEMVVEILADPEPALQWLEREGIKVFPMSDRILHRRERCVDCGSCAGVCPTGALEMDEMDQLVFKPEECVFCLFCVDACPTGAIDYLE